MKVRKSLGFGLIVALAAMATMAFAASSASATEVVPAGKQIAASLKEDTQSNFYPKNGYNSVYLSCEDSTARFKVPAKEEGQQYNENDLEVGTLSQGQGSVSLQVQPEPEFLECAVWLSEEQGAKGVKVAGAEVATTDKWMLAAEEKNIGGTSIAQLAIGVPQAGATITIDNQAVPPVDVCDITIGDGQQSVVMGSYDNATQQASFDGQLKYTTTPLLPEEAGCESVEGRSPAQYEAEYVTSVVGQPLEDFEILP